MKRGAESAAYRRNVLRFPGLEALGRAAAEEFGRVVASAQAERGRATVALGGGTTPRRLYERLAAGAAGGRVEWGRVEFFWSDERAVPPDHERSNYRLARQALLDPLGVPAQRVHRMEAERADLEAAARDYEAAMAAAFGLAPGGPPPALDLVLLGLGADGHTASLFPRNSVLQERRRWVRPVHAPPLEDRLTLTVPVLNAAAHVFFLVAGADKAEAVAGVLQGAFDRALLPAQGIRPAGELVWFVDDAAAGRLSGLSPASRSQP